MQESHPPTSEDRGLSREDLDIPSSDEGFVDGEGKEGALAEVIELRPRAKEAEKPNEVVEARVVEVVERALVEKLDGIEENSNAKSWLKKINDLSKDSKVFFAGEVMVSAISAFWAGGMTLETAEALSQNRKFDAVVFGIVSVIAALVSLGSGVRARRYGTVPNPEKLSWAENEAQ